ncbi:nucleic acid/nucleotide deaminase domain-containing protein [Aspergillus mulundensis]|uniref:Uncharacterized protein n=1 Tax=Aspergillus mulundensis TaxID=1810919 RepID=A0A3D8R8Z7_9EURO|nr:hypothetical protein DSM5745_08038 [Aspergillus mulundensis]RDW70527.1 hypothetical protein DSM5745_08038 [Aspergillus mulundensis]
MVTNPEPIVCAEDIALSSLFHSIPVAPTRNSANSLPTPRKQYTLPFDTERRLVGALAFLAHSKDDVDHIPAVCLEEDAGSGLKVIVAVNNARYADGEGALLRIERGFERIFAVLEGGFTAGGSYPQENLEAQILKEIVAMCSLRILCRLRLASSRKKASFQDTLRHAVLAVKNMRRQKLAERDLVKAKEKFEVRAKEVNKLIDSWSRYQVIVNVVRIVEGVHQLQQIVQLPALIRMIPNQAMSPTARESLLNIVGKVSRYHEAARLLYRTAKKFPLARTMKTVPVRLPREAFGMPSGLLDKYAPDLLSKLAEASPKRKGKAQGQPAELMTEICTALSIPQQGAMEQYSKQVMKTLKEGKFHAEVQLVAYCELERPAIYPRVICSSKDACFLCNMFLHEYGKIYTPQTHGRLYPGWKLPWVPQLAEVERRFGQAIGDYSRQSCASLLATRKRVALPCPNESTLFTLPLSSTTVAIESESVVSEASETRTKPTPMATPAESAHEYGERSSVHLSPSPSPAQSSDHTDKSTLVDGPGVYNDITTTEEHCPEPHKAPAYHTMAQNLEVTGDLAPGTSSDVYRAGPLQIEIEHATGVRHITYRLQWLGVEEAMPIQAHAQGNGSIPTSTPLVDAENLGPGSAGTVSFSGQNSLYVTAKGAVLRINWTADRLERS